MFRMGTQQQPLHMDRHRSSFNVTLIFALAVVVLGLINQGPQGLLFVLLGVGFAAYTWLTTPREYLIYADALVIKYGTPRVRPIPFASISHLETLALPMGERLRIRMTDGKRTFLMAKDHDTFRQRLEEALGIYHQAQGGGEWVEAQGTLVEERQPEQPLNTVGTVFETDAPSYDAPPLESGPTTEAEDDPRGPVTPFGGTTAVDDDTKPPY